MACEKAELGLQNCKDTREEPRLTLPPGEKFPNWTQDPRSLAAVRGAH
jgi:hypothetical protein